MGEVNEKMAAPDQLRRSLKIRHMGMIAIGGAIGTGLFVASGTTISTAGPGGALLAYAAIGLVIYFIMTGLGEMATYLPIAGSFQTYASRFVDPALGFSLGWTYAVGWAITIAGELVASAIVMKFWFPDTPATLWNAIFLVLLFSINLISTKAFGETEFYFAGIKVVAVCTFLIVGVLLILGVGGNSPGFSNWTVGEAPFVGGVPAVINIFLIAGYSFQGAEVVAITAGESENPERNIPIAVRSVFFRILIFYIGAITVIGFLIPYTDPLLLRDDITDIAVSPFTLVFKSFGLSFAASVMNFVILTSILSAANSALYCGSRMLYAMGTEGKAPKALAKLNKRGVPVVAVIGMTSIGLFCFLTAVVGEGTAYIWLINCSALIGFILWGGMALSHYRFRKGLKAQGHKIEDLKYKAKFYPIGPLFAIAMCILVIVFQDYGTFTSGNIDWGGVFVTYISVPVFLIIYFSYKIINKTKIVSLKDMDIRKNA